MPRYLLRYRVQTCLTEKKDVDLTLDGHRAVFLFGQKLPHDTAVLVQIELDAANNREAQTLAASFVLPQILDSLSFSTGTPLLLQNCERPTADTFQASILGTLKPYRGRFTDQRRNNDLRPTYGRKGCEGPHPAFM